MTSLRIHPLALGAAGLIPFVVFAAGVYASPIILLGAGLLMPSQRARLASAVILGITILNIHSPSGMPSDVSFA